MEIHYGVQGQFLLIDIIFLIIGIVIMIAVLFAHFTQKIRYNYYICILLILRICFGLIQSVTFNGNDNYALSNETNIIWGYNSYCVADGFIFLIIHVSHKEKILVALFLHVLAISCLYIHIFKIIDMPKSLQEWQNVVFYGFVILFGVFYKLYWQKKVQE